MPLDRSLWVDDKYAVRCRECQNEFTFVRRRHHCRQCGQVFCRACLFKTPATASAAPREALPRDILFLLEEKVCVRCATRLLEHQGVYEETHYEFNRKEGRGDGESSSSPLVKVGEHAPAVPVNASAEGTIPPLTGIASEKKNEKKHSRFVAFPSHFEENEEDRSVAYSVGSVSLYRNVARDRQHGVGAWVDKLSEDIRSRERALHSSGGNGVDPTITFLQEHQCSTKESAEGVAKGASFLPTEWREEAIATHTRRVHYMCLQYGLDNPATVAALCAIAWKVVDMTQTAWGGDVRDHVHMFPFSCRRLSSSGATDAPRNDPLPRLFLLSGLVLPARLVSKRMPSAWEHRPRILLLGGEVTLTPESNTYGGSTATEGSLGEYVESYKGYLDKLFQRIKVWSPQVIVVERGMHHYLQKRVTEDGRMSLLVHAGREALDRLAAGCHAGIVADLQYVGLAELREPSRSPLGTCRRFQALDGDMGGVCVFEGLPQPWFTSVLVDAPSGTGTSLPAVQNVLLDALLVASHLAAASQLFACLGWRSPELGTGVEGLLTECEGMPSMNMTMGSHSFGGPRTEGADRLEANRVLFELVGVHSATVDASPLADGDEAQRVSGTDAPATAQRSPATLLPTHGVEEQVRGGSGLEPDPQFLLTGSTEQHLTTQAPVKKAPAKPPNPRRMRHVSYTFYNRSGDVSLLGFLLEEIHNASRDSFNRFLLVHRSRKVTVSHRTVDAAQDGEVYRSLMAALSLDAADADSLRTSCRFEQRLGRMRATTDAGSIRGGGGPEDVDKGMASKYSVCGLGVCQGGLPLSVDTCVPIRDKSARALASHSFGALLDVLFNKLPLVGNRRGVCLSFVICVGTPAYAAPSNKGTNLIADGSSSLHVVTLDLTQIPIFALTPPPMRCVPIATSDTSSPHHTKRGALVEAIHELERNVLVVHGYILQCLTEADGEDRPLTASKGSAPPHPLLEGGWATPAPATSQNQSSHQHTAEVLPSLQRQCAQLAKSLREQVHSFSDVDRVYWHELAPLIHELQAWLREHHRDAKELPLPRCYPLLVYAPQARVPVAARVGEPTTFIAAALQQHMVFSNSVPVTENDLGKPPVSPVLPASRMEESAKDDAVGDKGGWRATALRTLRSLAKPSETTPQTTAPEPLTAADRSTQRVSLDFVDCTGSPSCTVTVDVLFPNQFAALQQLYTGNDREGFLDALRRCRVHQPQGGKSNSAFLITADGKYLLKDVKSQELRHFPVWAAQYFHHMADALEASENDETGEHGCKASSGHAPTTTLLAKTLGLFSVHTAPVRATGVSGSLPMSPLARTRSALERRVSFLSADASPHSMTKQTAPGDTAEGIVSSPARRSEAARVPSYASAGNAGIAAGGEVHHFVLMENTANRAAGDDNNRDPTHVPFSLAFDLKGSQRNRNAPQGSMVKLDVDLVQGFLQQGKFFFCASPQKRWLSESLLRDAQLLQAAGVMDYSLFVTLHQLTPGGPAREDGSSLSANSVDAIATPRLDLSIIDYLHPFTGAKLLESRVKSGLDTVLGYSGRDPTIIDPAAYAERFLRWMNCYFCEVPGAEASCDTCP